MTLTDLIAYHETIKNHIINIRDLVVSIGGDEKTVIIDANPTEMIKYGDHKKLFLFMREHTERIKQFIEANILYAMTYHMHGDVGFYIETSTCEIEIGIDSIRTSTSRRGSI